MRVTLSSLTYRFPVTLSRFDNFVDAQPHHITPAQTKTCHRYCTLTTYATFLSKFVEYFSKTRMRTETISLLCFHLYTW
jgi:hypothetical protein